MRLRKALLQNQLPWSPNLKMHKQNLKILKEKLKILYPKLSHFCLSQMRWGKGGFYEVSLWSFDYDMRCAFVKTDIVFSTFKGIVLHWDIVFSCLPRLSISLGYWCFFLGLELNLRFVLIRDSSQPHYNISFGLLYAKYRILSGYTCITVHQFCCGCRRSTMSIALIVISIFLWYLLLLLLKLVVFLSWKS